MIIRIDPSECSPHFVLHAINSHGTKQTLLSIARAGGATREALTKDVVQNTAITIPPPHLAGHFGAVAGKFFEQSEILGAQNSQLTKARDILLPRLMNGEVSV